MYIIGITGGSGAGKSIAMQALKTLGALTLDCDAIYHELLIDSTQMKTAIRTRFNDVLTDGVIDRKKLGEIVWSEPESLHDLNAITHSFINDEVDKRIDVFKTQGGKIAAIEAIALIESGKSSKCDVVVGITAPVEKRLSRIIKRDNITIEYAKKRINAQQQDSYYIDNCDYILGNIYDTHPEFENKCIEFFEELMRRTDP